MQSVELKYWHSLQSIQGVKEVEGTPNAISLQGLQNITAYRCQAVWKDNGTPFAESNTAAFTTLPAGSISLTLHNISRENYNYRVHYLYTSTYTLSSAVLSCNGQTFQGTVSGNTITFIVTGLTAGNAYLYNVTATDIYGFSETANGSITTTVVNQVNLYYDSRTENTITFSLAYLHDYTFIGGWVEVWNSTQDPSTDNPISSEVWFDGDTQVTATGLTYETEYKFRAGMTVEDAFGSQTTVYSSVVTATTADHDYSNDYFTIKNEYAGSNPLKIISTTSGFQLDYSTDNGSNWNTVNLLGGEKTIATMNDGDKVLLRHVGDFPNNRISIKCGYLFSVSGNAASLVYGSNFVGGSLANSYFYGLFTGATTLTDASKLVIYNTIKSMGYMFNGCTSLTTPPDLSNFTSVGNSVMAYMFNGCTSLTTPPDLSNVSTVGESGMIHMLYGCSSLTTAPNLSRITTIPKLGMAYMFQYCTSLTTPPNLSGITSVGESGMCGMFIGCTSLTSISDFTNLTTIGDYALMGIFTLCSAMTVAPNFRGITTVNTQSLYQMFDRCTSLTSTPDLSSIRTVGQGGMREMFNGCARLTSATNLNGIATLGSNGCYAMFKGCTSITAAPSLPSVSSLQNGGEYQDMFYGCTSLVTAPDLSRITTVGNGSMSSMFYGCTALATAPDMSGITDVKGSGMGYMFNDCTALTTAPNLCNVTTIGSNGMQRMYQGCRSLTKVYAPTIDFTNAGSGTFKDWVSNTAASGTMYADSSIASTIPTGSTSGCPTGWTVQTI